MYNKVVIAGVGSLGSFFSYHLAKSGCIKEMLLYDSDIVDEKNLKNSIFTKEDIGKPKVYSIRNRIIRDCNNIKVDLFARKYIEGETKLPNDVDLVIDCSDNFQERKGITDVKMYFQHSDFLIIDCRKNTSYKPLKENSSYSIELIKSKIELATMIASQYFYTGIIKELIISNKLHSIDLDFPTTDFYKNKNSVDHVNVLYDANDKDDILEDFDLHVCEILDKNKEYPVVLQLKNNDKQIKYKELKVSEFKDIDHVRNQILSLIDNENSYYRINVPLARKGKFLVKIIPQTISA